MNSPPNNAPTIHPIIVPTRSDLKSFNYYLVEDNDTLTLIDAGIKSEKCWTFLQIALKEAGFDLKDLTQIVITHNHEDHVGLVDGIVEHHPVPVHVPSKSIIRLKRDRSFFRMRIEFFKDLYEKMDCGDYGKKQIEKLQNAMKDHTNRMLQAEVIPMDDSVFDRWNVVDTPGHSPDHIALWDPVRKNLFSGDHLIRHISSNAIVEPDEDGNRLHTVVDYERSLMKCLDFDADIVYSGHGEPIHNHHELVKQRLNGIQRKADRIHRHVNSGIFTANDLAQSIYPSKYDRQFSLVMSEIIGHLDYLEQHGRVEKELRDGIWKYSVIEQ